MQYDTANTYLWFYVPDAINLVLNKINNTPSVPAFLKKATHKKKQHKKTNSNEQKNAPKYNYIKNKMSFLSQIKSTCTSEKSTWTL